MRLFYLVFYWTKLGVSGCRIGMFPSIFDVFYIMCGSTLIYISLSLLLRMMKQLVVGHHPPTSTT